MKESILHVKGDGNNVQEATVILTDEHLIIRRSQNNKNSNNKTKAPKKAHFEENPEMPSNLPNTKTRTVTIKRQTGGGLGISVKGGAEHGIPVLISRVFAGQAADQTHLLYPGDAIIAVNDTEVEHMKHDDVVAVLRKCGDDVTLTVREFDGASHVLRTASASSNNNPSSPSTDKDITINATDDAKVNSRSDDQISNNATEVNDHTSTNHTIDTNNLTTVTDGETKQMKQIDGDIKIPLLMARMSRYKTGQDEELENKFIVCSSCDKLNQTLIFDNTGQCDDWASAVSQSIHKQNILTINKLNGKLGPSNQIFGIGWISHRNISNNKQPFWIPKFAVVQGQTIKTFNKPQEFLENGSLVPSNERNSKALYESLFRVHSFDKLLDKKKYCFSIQHDANDVSYCSVETKDDLDYWDRIIHQCVHQSVYNLQNKSYECEWQGQICLLTIQFSHGFRLDNITNKENLWCYRFSQLKSSSDDGKSQIEFAFLNKETNKIESQVLTCKHAYQLLFCVHSFLEAKIAQVDPEFLTKVSKLSTSSTEMRTGSNSNSHYLSSPEPTPKTPMAPRLVLEGRSPH